MEVSWAALEDQEGFPNNYVKGKSVVLPVEPLLVRRKASGTKVLEGGHVEARPIYRTKFANCGMFLKYALLAWHRYFADGIDVKVIPFLEEQDA